MSYQFSIDQTNRSLKFPVIVMAGIVGTVIAAYAFAGCGDRTPDQAAAGERVAPPTSTVPVGNVSAETSAPRVISGPVTFEMADSAYRDRRYDDAAALFKSYTETKPSNAWGFYMLGLSAWKSGDRVTAESAFVQALALDPTHVKSQLNLSRVLLESGQPDSALVNIDAALQLDSISSEPVRLQGRAFEALGKTDDAILAYSRAKEVGSSGFRTNSEEQAPVDLHQDTDQDREADEGQIEHHVADPDRLEHLAEQPERRVGNGVDDLGEDQHRSSWFPVTHEYRNPGQNHAREQNQQEDPQDPIDDESHDNHG